ncbi:uncharacterized protein PHACADRAFT_209187 [Phanerochaete carnosa HHB-10118-sp]|uniref:F-box domain-containing protein n=1 Tax=Phanerochaete carnosa (strain HHB-10118-sp) TaxID=650164 RepID=K5UZQ9_PHACS|nr:uncharacterized protein PHACADRAFT_209187 [Phanerochaete carnosa HHB-10118-sp]EKM55666.1 hypothetical protein PHACADRAFT_209187 [Phanerochaete carnosa HHB-10118-sp]
MPPRRSKRIKLTHPSEDAPTEAAAANSATKVAVAKGTKPRRKRGKLSGLTSMPLDVVIEVVMHLEPYDLLSLARTTKIFRQFLMSNSSAFLWTAARDNLEGYPPCPEDMNEPALASFLYTNYCSRCLKPNVKWIYWDLRARYCKSCAVELGPSLEGMMTLRYLFKQALPDTIPELNERQLALWFFIPSFNYKFRESEINELRDALRERPEKYKEVLEERLKRMRQIRACISVMQGWYDQKLKAREEELRAIRSDRYAGIMDRLRELGWEEELRRVMNSETAHDIFTNLPCVKEPRLLTDRTWANIRDTLVQWLEETREQMIQEELVRVTRVRLRVFDRALGAICPYRLGEPSRVDIALGMPEVREVVNRPPRETINAESFAFLRDVLPAFRTQWRREAEAYLGGLVRAQVGKLPKGVDPMELAVGATFRCQLCDHVEKYPEVLSHACERHAFGDDEEKGDLYRHIILQQFKPESRYPSNGLVHWDPRVFKFSADTNTMRPLVELLGLNYRRATRADMDASPKRLACKTCDTDGVIRVLNWASAYEHYSLLWSERMTEEEYRQWKREGSDTWKAKGCYIDALSEHQAEAARLLERTAEKDSVGSVNDRDWWLCGLCPTLERCGDTWSGRYSKARVVEHVQQKHQIEAPDAERDYYCLSARAFTDGRPEVYLVSEALRTSEKKVAESEFKRGAAVYIDLEESDDEAEAEAEAEPPRPAKNKQGRQHRKKAGRK